MAGIHPIKKLRNAGITHKAVGAAVGVSAQTVWRWEHGERVPRKRHLIELKEKFGIEPAAILCFEPKQESAA